MWLWQSKKVALRNYCLFKEALFVLDEEKDIMSVMAVKYLIVVNLKIILWSDVQTRNHQRQLAMMHSPEWELEMSFKLSNRLRYLVHHPTGAKYLIIPCMIIIWVYLKLSHRVLIDGIHPTIWVIVSWRWSVRFNLRLSVVSACLSCLELAFFDVGIV
jgi:hypothetical protein